ncbi:sensor histidine kinase [Embleya hyalina]|uniref:histidine kinase n=1 Tax=Embleya hyalina TaxID=516124 RepID=A0A401YG89_9ACTN|nr:ATP-binding protein [Embleya hyalina]GCD93631.1 histidine kinase [Embleya hyalina]
MERHEAVGAGSGAPGIGTRRHGWDTRRWLLVGVATTLVVSALLAALGAWVFSHSTSVNGRLVDHSSPALIAAVRLETAYADQDAAVRGYVWTGDASLLDGYATGRATEQEQAAVLRELFRDDPTARDELRVVQERARAWQDRVVRPALAVPPGSEPPAEVRAAVADTSAYPALRIATLAQQHRLQRQRDSARADLQDVRDLRTWVFSGIALVVAGGAIMVFAGLRHGVTRPMSRLVADANAVARGDFRHEIIPTGPADLRALAHAMEAMRRRLADELAFSDDARHRLDEQATELRRSNADLEQFAYVASHDLQEPLRKIASFCRLLDRRYHGQLDERADRYLDFAVDGAVRMQTLIDDLLAFSRMGRGPATEASVDLNAVYETVIGDLDLAIRDAHAEVRRTPLPTVRGDRTQLSLVVQNLIANAVKFRKPDRPVRVSVEAETEAADGMWRISVTDDGIGIDPSQADRIFVIFQRLHTREAYPGNGMGLAMCKKIVEFHGGTIGLDPEYTAGTRIVLTLPAAERPDTEAERPEAERPGLESASERRSAGRGGKPRSPAEVPPPQP